MTRRAKSVPMTSRPSTGLFQKVRPDFFVRNRALLSVGALSVLLPAPAFAEVCDKMRPAWDGLPVSAWQEALFLFTTVPSLVLLLATALAVRFRHQWGALIVVVLWTILITMVTMADPTGLQDIAKNEGCVGQPTLFIALVAAICGAMILYTAPRKAKPDGDT